MSDRKPSSSARVLEFRPRRKSAGPEGPEPTTNAGCIRPAAFVLEHHSLAVFRAFASGRRVRVIAAQYGVSVAEIEGIVREFVRARNAA